MRKLDIYRRAWLFTIHLWYDEQKLIEVYGNNEVVESRLARYQSELDWLESQIRILEEDEKLIGN